VLGARSGSPGRGLGCGKQGKHIAGNADTRKSSVISRGREQSFMAQTRRGLPAARILIPHPGRMLLRTRPGRIEQTPPNVTPFAALCPRFRSPRRTGRMQAAFSPNSNREYFLTLLYAHANLCGGDLLTHSQRWEVGRARPFRRRLEGFALFGAVLRSSSIPPRSRDEPLLLAAHRHRHAG